MHDITRKKTFLNYHGNITVAASGGFDPIHVGHIEYLKMAKSLGDKLIVILNTDDFLMQKKGFVFMPFEERKTIIESIKYVDEVIRCIDADLSVCKTLALLKPDIFAKGGDRMISNIPEVEVCGVNNIKIVDGLGNKIQSSTWLTGKVK